MFADRIDAGRRLASRLQHLRDASVVVLGLPRGGVPVAAEVARALEAPLDVIVVRKLGVPFQPELAMGAIGEGGVRILNARTIRMAGVTVEDLATVEAKERDELERRARRFRLDRPRLDLDGRTAVIVDDGLATGSTARAACRVARAHGANRVVLAVPVAPPGWEARIGTEADECIALATPEPFWAIGQFYAHFAQTTDEEVIECLTHSATPASPGPTAADADAPSGVDREVEICAGPTRLRGRLTLPHPAAGIVVFAHGSGSSRHSPRNRFVAAEFNRAGLGTLLFDLLTAEEEHDRANVFDIGLLARRLVEVTGWLRAQPECAGLSVGYFGASTGAAAALWAATEPGSEVSAVVCRGGRPDLAASRLSRVAAPTLLIVGSDDDLVLELNQQALARMRCEARLAIVPGATHLFEEPGTLQAAADQALHWFTSHLAGRAQPVG